MCGRRAGADTTVVVVEAPAPATAVVAVSKKLELLGYGATSRNWGCRGAEAEDDGAVARRLRSGQGQNSAG
eukprot:SAG11_NODE_303_length_11000_cov_7.979635_11_plen_71_part_00